MGNDERGCFDIPTPKDDDTLLIDTVIFLFAVCVLAGIAFYVL